MIKFLRKSPILNLKFVRRFTQRIEIDSVPLQFVGNPKASVLKDFLDYSGEISNFKKTNQINKESKFHSEQPQELKIKEDLRLLLGENFGRYANQIYQIEMVGTNTSIHVPSSSFHPKYDWNTKLFKNQQDLREFRKLESQGFHGLKTQYPESPQYPLQNLKSIFKPIEFCKHLKEDQLIIFNIPLNVNEEQIKAFLESKLKELDVDTPVSQVKISLCKLSLNSSATISLKDRQTVLQVKAKLHMQRFNGCVLDVKSLDDGESENAWDRTLVLVNLEPSLQLQEVIHLASQYGRVTNFVVPKMILNPDLPIEDELIESLEKQNLHEPVRLMIYDLENNKIIRKFWPSEEDFMDFNKNNEVYNDLEESYLDFQEIKYQKDIQERLFFLKSERVYNCVRVPIHLKDEYRQLWLPKKDKQELSMFQRQLKQLYSKQYVNLGYSVVTYPSKLMAQRALYNINLSSSKDLSLLELNQINQPRFWPDQTPQHTENERYGHKFRIENIFIGKHSRVVQAIKAWDGMELYQIDYLYIINQMERLRKEQVDKIEQTRQKMNEDTIPRDQDEEILINRKEELRQRVMRELSEPVTSQQFDQMVMRQNFSQHQDLFTETLQPILSDKPGRKFDINVLESDYEQQIARLITQQKQIQGDQIRYVDEIVRNNQKEYLDKARDARLTITTKIETDEIDQDLEDRLIDRLQRIKTERETVLEPFDKLNQAASKAALDYTRANSIVKRQKQKLFDAESKIKPTEQLAEGEEAQEEAPKDDAPKEMTKKSSSKFSTYNKKQEEFLDDRQHEIKREAFLKLIKKMMFGTLSPQEKQEMFSNENDLNDMDMLKHNQLYAQDHLNNNYLTKEVIEQIREFDLPEQEDARMLIRQQEFNRKYLVALVPDEFMKKLRDEGREHLTDSLLQFYRDGFPTESFQLEQEVDGNILKDELNRFVAGSGEKYHYEVDEMTKKKYILKSEKPYFKYDLSAVVDVNRDEMNEQLIKLLQENYKMSRDKAQQMIYQSMETGEIAKPLAQLFDKYKDIDIEKTCREQNITKRQLDVHLNNDIFNESELFYREVQEQFEIEEIKLKNQELNPDNIVKDSGEKWKLKDKAGQFIVPKYRKI